MSGLDNGLYHRLDIIRFIPSMWDKSRLLSGLTFEE